MSQVVTKLGLLPRKDLQLKYEFSETDNSVGVAIEFYYQGELVRRSAWADVLNPGGIGGAIAGVG